MDDGGSPLWGCLTFLLFLILNSILYGFGSAMQNIHENEIEKDADDGVKKAIRIQRMLEDPSRLIGTIQIVATLVSIVTGYLGIRFFVQWIFAQLDRYVPLSGSALIALRAAAVFVIFFITLVLLVGVGILAPKKIAARSPEKTAYRLYGPVRSIVWLFTPLTASVAAFSNQIVRIFGIDPHEKSDVTEEEIINIVDEAHEQGVIMESEAEMIQNIMEYSEKDAGDIMTHRKNIIALEHSMTLSDAIKLMLAESNSRYPVYIDDIDNIIGIIYLKDAMKQFMDQKNADKPVYDIPNLIRNVAFIPETRGIDDIFRSMQAKKVHMVIVVDEYGQTAGLVAMEDILEEIVGNIQDEYDEDEIFIHPQYDDSILMDGLTPLEQVGEVLNVNFDDEEFETLNGYLTSLLDHIPTEKDKEVFGSGYRFQILSVKNNIIQKVRVERNKKQQKGEEPVCQDTQNSQT